MRVTSRSVGGKPREHSRPLGDTHGIRRVLAAGGNHHPINISPPPAVATTPPIAEHRIDMPGAHPPTNVAAGGKRPSASARAQPKKEKNEGLPLSPSYSSRALIIGSDEANKDAQSRLSPPPIAARRSIAAKIEARAPVRIRVMEDAEATAKKIMLDAQNATRPLSRTECVFFGLIALSVAAAAASTNHAYFARFIKKVCKQENFDDGLIWGLSVPLSIAPQFALSLRSALLRFSSAGRAVYNNTWKGFKQDVRQNEKNILITMGSMFGTALISQENAELQQWAKELAAAGKDSSYDPTTDERWKDILLSISVERSSSALAINGGALADHCNLEKEGKLAKDAIRFRELHNIAAVVSDEKGAKDEKDKKEAADAVNEREKEYKDLYDRRLTLMLVNTFERARDAIKDPNQPNDEFIRRMDASGILPSLAHLMYPEEKTASCGQRRRSDERAPILPINTPPPTYVQKLDNVIHASMELVKEKNAFDAKDVAKKREKQKKWYKLCVSTNIDEQKEVEPGSFYIQKITGAAELKYTVINPEGTQVTGTITAGEVKAVAELKDPATEDSLLPLLPDILDVTLTRKHTEIKEDVDTYKQDKPTLEYIPGTTASIMNLKTGTQVPGSLFWNWLKLPTYDLFDPSLYSNVFYYGFKSLPLLAALGPVAGLVTGFALGGCSIYVNALLNSVAIYNLIKKFPTMWNSYSGWGKVAFIAMALCGVGFGGVNAATAQYFGVTQVNLGGVEDVLNWINTIVTFVAYTGLGLGSLHSLVTDATNRKNQDLVKDALTAIRNGLTLEAHIQEKRLTAEEQQTLISLLKKSLDEQLTSHINSFANLSTDDTENVIEPTTKQELNNMFGYKGSQTLFRPAERPFVLQPSSSFTLAPSV